MAEDRGLKIQYENAGEIFKLGWRQGSIIPDTLFENLKSQNYFPKDFDNSSNAILIVVSQDCDVCNDSYEKEPWVEILLAIEVEDKKSQLFHGNHPREIQFEISDHGSNKVFQSSIHNKFRIRRGELSQHSPHVNKWVHEDTVRDIKHWIAKRYTRQGFPNEFEARVSRSKAKLTSKVFAKPQKGGLFTAIFLSTSHEELPETENYNILLFLTMTLEDYNIQDKKEEVEKIGAHIAEVLNSCEGIEVEDFEVRSEADLSLNELKQMKRWDFDALSFAEDLPIIAED